QFDGFSEKEVRGRGSRQHWNALPAAIVNDFILDSSFEGEPFHVVSRFHERYNQSSPALEEGSQSCLIRIQLIDPRLNVLRQ
ncbi:MAG: hypothetical protein QF473_28365, partial [Planctomycetota bacterium]|nr:hypothetical protein [Planctomycetota bacterium]